MIDNNSADDAAMMREQQELQEAAAVGLRNRLWAERARNRRLEREARFVSLTR